MAHLKRLLPGTSMTEDNRHDSDFSPLVLYAAVPSLIILSSWHLLFFQHLTILHYRLLFLSGCSSVFYPRIRCLHLPLLCFSPSSPVIQMDQRWHLCIGPKWSSYCLLLHSRLRPLAQSQTAPNSNNSHTSDCFKCGANKYIFSQLQPTYFTYPKIRQTL